MCYPCNTQSLIWEWIGTANSTHATESLFPDDFLTLALGSMFLLAFWASQFWPEYLINLGLQSCKVSSAHLSNVFQTPPENKFQRLLNHNHSNNPSLIPNSCINYFPIAQTKYLIFASEGGEVYFSSVFQELLSMVCRFKGRDVTVKAWQSQDACLVPGGQEAEQGTNASEKRQETIYSTQVTSMTQSFQECALLIYEAFLSSRKSTYLGDQMKFEA